MDSFLGLYYHDTTPTQAPAPPWLQGRLELEFHGQHVVLGRSLRASGWVVVVTFGLLGRIVRVS